MNKKTLMIVGATVVVTLIASNKLKALPLLKSLPTI